MHLNLDNLPNWLQGSVGLAIARTDRRFRRLRSPRMALSLCSISLDNQQQTATKVEKESERNPRPYGRALFGYCIVAITGRLTELVQVGSPQAIQVAGKCDEKTTTRRQQQRLLERSLAMSSRLAHTFRRLQKSII